MRGQKRDQDKDQAEVRHEQQALRRGRRLEAREAEGEELYLHEVRREPRVHDDPYRADDEHQAEEKHVRAGSVFFPCSKQPDDKDVYERERQDVAGDRARELNAPYPRGHGVQEIPQMPQEHQDKGDVKNPLPEPERGVHDQKPPEKEHIRCRERAGLHP